MRRYLTALAVAAFLPAAAAAQSYKAYEHSGSFEDAAFGVETAIVNRGLVVDFVSHVGEMLKRTGEDVGSERMLFQNADVYLFCSAVLSRKVMEADIMNIAHCPYGVFVAEVGDKVAVGYRHMPEGPLQEVEALLDEIAREATGN